MNTPISERRFFLTASHACSYLPQREAATLFVDPQEHIPVELYQSLTEQGFRRSGSHLYRPHCNNCQACIPTRIPVADFQPRRGQKRTQKRNKDLKVRIEPATFDQCHYDLYARYIHGRHRDGDMYPPTPEQYRAFLLSNWSDTSFISAFEGDHLVSVAVTDQQPNALSAIYTFFDPDLADRSLGVFSILSQIALCQEMNLPYLYLGYWIREAEKMRYKIDYRPIELFIKGRWIVLS